MGYRLFQRPPIFWLVCLGFCLSMLEIDFTHANHLGVAQWVVALGLPRAVEEGVTGMRDRWEKRINAGLLYVFHACLQWCTTHGVARSEREWTTVRLFMASNIDWPCYKSKAHNTEITQRDKREIIT